jgi:hypothetical protein
VPLDNYEYTVCTGLQFPQQKNIQVSMKQNICRTLRIYSGFPGLEGSSSENSSPCGGNFLSDREVIFQTFAVYWSQVFVPTGW